jgi:hypothetical protein
MNKADNRETAHNQWVEQITEAKEVETVASL